MRKLTTFAFIVTGFAAVVQVQAQELPEFPKPTEQHEWLQQLAGQWEYEATMHMPGQEPVKSKGTESVRSVGGFWIVGENRGDFMGQPFTGLLTLGFDAEQDEFTGTWVDSVCGHLWKYEGTLDKDTNTLTLLTEGPCPMQGGKPIKMRETLQLKNPEQKVFMSEMQGEDGSWTKTMQIDYRRKK